MFGSPQKALTTYARIGIETGVAAASPHQLIVMLFDGALISTSQAIQEINAGHIAAKGLAISRAIMIIESGLRASLNKEIGGAIALNLDALYEYMSNRLFTANLNNDVGLIEEVRTLLLDLKKAWEQVPATAGLRTATTTLNSGTQSSNISLGS